MWCRSASFRLLREEQDASAEARAGFKVAGGGRGIPGKLGLTTDDVSQGALVGVVGTVRAEESGAGGVFGGGIDWRHEQDGKKTS